MDSKNVPERWREHYEACNMNLEWKRKEGKVGHTQKIKIRLIEELAEAERRVLIAEHAYMTEMPIDTPNFKEDFQRGLYIAEQQLIEMGKIQPTKK